MITDNIKVIVFDFDGTLVESNKPKYDAFFKLFPNDDYHRGIISGVLSTDLEKSRYVILKHIIDKLGVSNEKKPEDWVASLAEKYNDLVIQVAKTCDEKPGAKEVLDKLSTRYHLYLSSTTPEEPLKEIINYRNWSGYFIDIYGYPRKKPETILEILQKESVDNKEIIVVGDGESDRTSASETGCQFYHINENNSLEKVLKEYIKGRFYGN